MRDYVKVKDPQQQNSALSILLLEGTLSMKYLLKTF